MAADGTSFAALGNDYHIVSFAPNGKPRWELRVPWPRDEVASELRGNRTASLRSRYEEPHGGFVVPTHHPSLYRIATDGCGHLYVFPWASPGEGDGWPVDVYDSKGKRVYAGMFIGGLPFEFGDCEFVYGAYLQASDYEFRVVRRELTTPF